MNLVYDIFPAATPLGTRLVQLTKEHLAVDSGFRVELYGLGSGRIIINRNQPECTAANFADDNFVQMFDIDISETIPLGGFFLDNRRAKVLAYDEEGGEIIQFGGPGALSYLGRQTWWNTNYVNFGNDAQFGPRADGNWWWYQDQYGDILERAIDEAQDSDRPVSGRGIPDLAHNFDGTTDSAGSAWVSFEGDYSIAVGTNYLEMIQRFRDLGITFQMTGELGLEAYQGFYGNDRTSEVFAIDKVLFINEDGGPGQDANIVEELTRQSKPSLKLSRVLVKGDAPEPTNMVSRTAGAYGVVREGFMQAQGIHATDLLEDLGDQALQLRSDSSDVPVFRHIPGQDALAGRYSPFPPESALPALLLPRLYFAGGDGTERTFDAAWTELGEDSGATTTFATTADGTGPGPTPDDWNGLPQNIAAKQIEYQLSGTVVFTGGSVRGQARAKAKHGIGIGAQWYQSQMVVRLFDSGGSLKGTLLSAHSPGALDSEAWSNEGNGGSNPPKKNAMFPADSQWTTPYGAPLEGSLTGVAGDYIVVEIGGRQISGQDGPAAGFGLELQCDQATDLPVGDQTQTTAANAWIEFWGAPTSEGAEWSYWLGDLVTLHTGTETADYTYQDLRVYAINWRLLENGEWWPEPELGGLIAGVQSQQVSAPPILGGSGGGGGVVTTNPPPMATVKKLLTNKSGGSVTHGDVVVVDLDNDESFDTTSTADETRIIGIVQGDIPADGVGYVAIHGYVELVNVTASVTRGDYGFTSTTVKEADAETARATGAFCQFLKGGTAPSAILFGPPDTGGATQAGSGTALPHGGFLATYHTDADERMDLLQSEDGITFSTLVQDLLESSHIIRDPSIIHWDGAYWIVATYPGSTNFRVYKTLDLSETPWTEVGTYTDAGNTATWAPEWVRNLDGTPYILPSTGFPCIMFSRSTGGNNTLREVHPTNRGMTAFSTAVTITGTGLPSNMIDAFCLTDGETFYLWYKQESTKRIEYMTSTTDLTSGYTVTESGDWAGWDANKDGGANSIEGPCVIRLDDGRWRIYFNEHSGFNSIRTVYSDSIDTSGSGPGGAWGTWTVQESIVTDELMGHGSVVFIPGVYDHNRDPFAHPDITADISGHEADPDPHPAYATDDDLSDHEAAGDPHSVYLTDAEHDVLAHPTTLLTVDAGTVTYDDTPPDVEITVDTVWGFDGTDAYYDSAGAAADEWAILAIDPTTGEYVVVPYTP